MPQNVNPWVSELLGWHGHDRGGVRVPFQTDMGKPLGVTLSTPLISRLRNLARDIVMEVPGTPRWIFLVGGPGNGKSEAVEAFVRELDVMAGSNGNLISTVSQKFAPDPLTPRRVKVTESELGDLLSRRVRKLLLIQDASAVDGPDQTAEEQVLNDLGDLVTSPAGQEPVFICCANRGLIARARSAIQSRPNLQWLNSPEVTGLLTYILTATGLGPSALTVKRPRCWPLEYDSRFAAWPLDLDTIVVSQAGSSPVEEMLLAASAEQKWQPEGGCGDCTSRELCPFYANAVSLQQEEHRRRLLKVLRHGELATGQRWNFRDAFSLCAELIVGQKEDFKANDSSISPCSWVHQHVDEVNFTSQPDLKLAAAWELAFHLYPQALFPGWPDPTDELDVSLLRQSGTSRAITRVFGKRQRPEGTQIRHLLAGEFSHKLDPAKATPSGSESLLRTIEDEFGQSIAQGLEKFRDRVPQLSELLELMALAEAHWSGTVLENPRVRAILETLRVLSSMLVKRSLGVQGGEYLNLEYLLDYESVIRDATRIRTVVGPLRAVLAPGDRFAGSLVRVFGQPVPEPSRDVIVTCPLGTVIPRLATTPSEDRPGHDLPWVEVEQECIPLTFDLFVALRLNSVGAEMASFPPHIRAAIDKVRNAIAGRLARDKESMLGGGVSIHVGALGQLVPGSDGVLEFRAPEEHQ